MAGEAYNLMLYQCEKCGTLEVLWNSRDGVTPFCISCRQCQGVNGTNEDSMPAMKHIAWHMDVKKEDYIPFEGQRIFVGSEDNPHVKVVQHKCKYCNKEIDFSYIVCGDCSEKMRSQTKKLTDIDSKEEIDRAD